MLSSKLIVSVSKGLFYYVFFYIDATNKLTVDGGRERKSENLSMSPEANLMPVEFLLY